MVTLPCFPSLPETHPRLCRFQTFCPEDYQLSIPCFLLLEVLHSPLALQPSHHLAMAVVLALNQVKHWDQTRALDLLSLWVQLALCS